MSVERSGNFSRRLCHDHYDAEKAKMNSGVGVNVDFCCHCVSRRRIREVQRGNPFARSDSSVHNKISHQWNDLMMIQRYRAPIPPVHQTLDHPIRSSGLGLPDHHDALFLPQHLLIGKSPSVADCIFILQAIVAFSNETLDSKYEFNQRGSGTDHESARGGHFGFMLLGKKKKRVLSRYSKVGSVSPLRRLVLQIYFKPLGR
ncbi:hypothetical protein EDD16DRAFT_1577082 [Pisolithus croceorrhizus]|nr:hypothetical protein EDD16DRAFT_1577082 [Pisolithus croceorrhizus]KAI6158676.1 hypothetical protein EDD17DRAFT_1621112 [Pisolithus thermaeus]